MMRETSSFDLPETLLASARRVALRLPERSDEANRVRDISAVTMREMRDASLFRVFQPARWGGYEMDPRIFFDIQNVISEACCSTAWVYGVLSVQSLVLALFDGQAQADVWGHDGGRALVSSSFQPFGKAEKVHGGFRLSGCWSFSRGSSHCDWAMVGAMLASDATGGTPVRRIFLLPRTDYNLLDVWNTFGLRGTGSNDILVENVFVPTYRTFSPEAIAKLANRSAMGKLVVHIVDHRASGGGGENA